MKTISFADLTCLNDNLNTIENAFFPHHPKTDINDILKLQQTDTNTTNKTRFEERFQKLRHEYKHPHEHEQPLTQRATISQAPENSPISAQFYTKLQQCTRCALHQSRAQAIEGHGANKPLVLVITEVVTELDDKNGLCMSGEDGELLKKMLSAISLSTNDNVYITPLVKCKPPQNKLPFLEQMYACKTFLDIQIQKLQPKFLLAFGSLTSLCLLSPRLRFQNIRGKIFDYKSSPQQKETIPLLVTYSPQTLLHDESLKRPAWQDLQLARKALDDIERGKAQ